MKKAKLELLKQVMGEAWYFAGVTISPHEAERFKKFQKDWDTAYKAIEEEEQK